ncbi:1,2-diacylglycerol 3-alpha-glucosyltransferase [Pseudomonas corrugata]|uniref:glycosyltransferase n=1 Tax=Pseudomonas corrugata TaxID=47879 RepID=UPI002862914A|nr:glycosyltransferase [Pseudomonas corrugata]MDR7281951.1 1,2-diacylglycerol 3-alpha-glucosyltransferase [Pseudomonas corrugata]
MLFIANVLELNGGTTFILRLAREFSKRGKKVGVLVLFDIIDKSLEDKIRQYADTFYLKDIACDFSRRAFKSQLGGFIPIHFSKIDDLVKRYESHVHVMGVFGLLFVKRYLNKIAHDFKLSFGIYHQNEIMFGNIDYYFALKAKALFSLLPAESIVFFNEKNRQSFEIFFGKSYAASTLIPIGVDIPVKDVGVTGDPQSDRIVSIGNLHEFKSYNRHVICMLPELKNTRPNLTYEIYGTGSYEPELVKLVSSLNLDSSVIFKGAIAYEDIPSVLKGALAFVGSGTAIVEASALGLPSIIGIESTVDPITYGFLADIEGFSYNELNAGQKTYLIEDKLIQIMKGGDAWKTTALSCKAKSQAFSVAHTANGFVELENKRINLELFSTEKYYNSVAAVSFLKCAIKHKFGWDREFASRRNQGTLA